MRRFLLLIGVGVLLVTAKTEAKEKNKRNFFGTEGTALLSQGDDFTLEGADKDGGSGDGNTHEDDEDFDVSSGEGEEVDKTYVDLTDDDSDEDKVDPHDGWSLDKKKASVHMTDDEDLYDGSGSGGGDVPEDVINISTPKTEAPTPEPSTETPVQLSACQNLRQSAVRSGTEYVPHCEDDGAFTATQCTDIAKEKTCWCVTHTGRKIEGTRMKSPEKPDCEFGSNLGGCVFQLVQNGQELLGAFRPRCTKDGMYEAIQCHGSQCWCVDALGNQQMGSFTNVPKQPDCDQFLKKNKTVSAEVTTEKPVTKAPIKTIPIPDDGYNVIDKDDSTDDIDVTIDQGDKDLEEKEEKTNEVGTEEDVPAPLHQDEPFIAQPGLLAAIIGGAVVGLLCMVLLVMFLVYRMRKKDEGSYPLEEQKYQNYSYAKAPDKEFYA